MGKGEAQNLRHRIRLYLKRLRDELERDSVSRAGPSHFSCCHVPGEVLERRSAACHEPARRETETRSGPA